MNDLQGEYDTYRLKSRYEKAAKSALLFSCISGCTFKAGEFFGRAEQDTKNQQAIERLQQQLGLENASERMGATQFPMPYKVQFDSAGHKWERIGYRPVPIATLKAEQTQEITKLKADHSIDFNLAFTGGVIGLVASGLLLTVAYGKLDLDDRISAMAEFAANKHQQLARFISSKMQKKENTPPAI